VGVSREKTQVKSHQTEKMPEQAIAWLIGDSVFVGCRRVPLVDAFCSNEGEYKTTWPVRNPGKGKLGTEGFYLIYSTCLST